MADVSCVRNVNSCSPCNSNAPHSAPSSWMNYARAFRLSKRREKGEKCRWSGRSRRIKEIPRCGDDDRGEVRRNENRPSKRAALASSLSTRLIEAGAKKEIHLSGSKEKVSEDYKVVRSRKQHPELRFRSLSLSRECTTEIANDAEVRASLAFAVR